MPKQRRCNMQASDFKRIAIKMYGDGWSHKLSDVLRINRRTVRDYAKGLRPIPPQISAMMQFWDSGASNE